MLHVIFPLIKYRSTSQKFSGTPNSRSKGSVGPLLKMSTDLYFG